MHDSSESEGQGLPVWLAMLLIYTPFVGVALAAFVLALVGM